MPRIPAGIQNTQGESSMNDKKSNDSTSLNPEFFVERFELNDDFCEHVCNIFINICYLSI